MILEITLKLRLTLKPNKGIKRCVEISQIMVLLFAILCFVTFIICVSIDSIVQRIENNYYLLWGILGFSSLFVFIIMLGANIALIR